MCWQARIFKIKEKAMPSVWIELLKRQQVHAVIAHFSRTRNHWKYVALKVTLRPSISLASKCPNRPYHKSDTTFNPKKWFSALDKWALALSQISRQWTYTCTCKLYLLTIKFCLKYSEVSQVCIDRQLWTEFLSVPYCIYTAVEEGFNDVNVNFLSFVRFSEIQWNQGN